jgi:hypothetical protein
MATRFGYILMFLLTAMSANLLAQQKATKNSTAAKADEIKPDHPQVQMVPVYLGDSKYQGGPIQKTTITGLLKQGLLSRDSAGQAYTVAEFDLFYSERNIYEDEVGNIMPMIDLSTIHSVGNTLPEAVTKGGKVSPSGEVSLSIYDRIKPGDTLAFDHIRVQKEPGSPKLIGKPMKFIIVR